MAETDICSRCGISNDEWSANEGQGFDLRGESYCCEGCAEDTGCTCETDKALAGETRDEASTDAAFSPKRKPPST